MTMFNYFEVVIVRETPKTIERGIANEEGVVVAMAVSEEDPTDVYYSVMIKEEVPILAEKDLESCGRFVPEESIYDGTSIRVPAQDYRGIDDDDNS